MKIKKKKSGILMNASFIRSRRFNSIDILFKETPTDYVVLNVAVTFPRCNLDNLFNLSFSSIKLDF